MMDERAEKKLKIKLLKAIEDGSFKKEHLKYLKTGLSFKRLDKKGTKYLEEKTNEVWTIDRINKLPDYEFWGRISDTIYPDEDVPFHIIVFSRFSKDIFEED